MIKLLINIEISSDNIDIIKPNKNNLGKILLKKLLLSLLFKVWKVVGETTAVKNIIDPMIKETRKFIRKIYKIIFDWGSNLG